MEQGAEPTIREIVRNDHRAAMIFEEFAIDFCCGGENSIDVACARKGIEPALVRKELLGLKETASDTLFRPAEWGLDVLADYIVSNHHRYVRRALPLLTARLEKLVPVHGGTHPELSQIADCFRQVAGELTSHMQQEELLLFPFIRMMASAPRGATLPPPPVRFRPESPRDDGIRTSLCR